MRRRWAGRLGAWLVVTGAVALALQVTGFDPVMSRVVLLGAVLASLAWVCVDVLVDAGPGWGVRVEPAVPETRADRRLAAYQRMLTSHLTGAAEDTTLRDALVQLTRRSLAQRHHLDLDDPAAGPRIHPDLRALAGTQPRRMSPAEIATHLRHIEEI